MASSGGSEFGQFAETEEPLSAYQPFSEEKGERSALELKYAAVTELGTLQPANQNEEQRKKRAVERINETLDVYLDQDRVESPHAFEGDAAAVSHLAALADTDAARVNETTWLLATANARTANVSITDARRAFERFEDNLDDPGHRNAIESHLRNAERAYERGNTALESEGSVEQTARERARAIRHFATAWRQSQQALDTIERQTSPQVQILTRVDPVRNGSASTNRTIGGTIEAVRPTELGNVTVTVEDGPSIEVQPSTSTVPASNVTFIANVTFEDREQRIRATLEESTNGKQKQGNGPPAHANGKSSTADASPTTDELLLDGDALPDTYERETTKTDPLNPDSASTKTPVDESDNGVIDGIEDFDSDNVTSYHEGRFGTDPFDEDTDDDGLPDRYEIRYSKLDQTRADTNGDGVTDDQWDIDNDSLTTLEEYEAGTRPTLADEDRDDLDDSRELEVGTDSSDPDTDGDGLSDSEELELGTDPLVRDSNGDGTPDGNATYTTQTANESLGVNVSLSGSGDIASGVRIEDGSQTRFDTDSIESAQVTSFVNLESEQSFESANVTFSYDESQLGETNESDLVVFRYNESMRMFEPLNTTVDSESNTVTGETEHFSRFVVFDVRNWASNFVADRPENGVDNGEIQPVDVTMIIDTSGSMSWNDPEEFRKQAAKEFVGALVEEDRAGVVDFDHDAIVAQELTTDFGQVNLTIDSLDANGGTDIGDGVQKANEHFDEASNDSRAQFAILLTDGKGDGGRAEARTAAQRNTTIYTIGFGDANGDKLEDIAQITDGNYTHVDDPSDLPNVFSRVAEDIGSQDTDGDGLADAVERRGVVANFWGTVKTDPYSADTDGDGLTDSEELEYLSEGITGEELRANPDEYDDNPWGETVYETVSKAGFNISSISGKVFFFNPGSDPTRVHSDSDGLDDYTERREPMTYVRTTSREETKTILEKEKPSEELFEDTYVIRQTTTYPTDPDLDNDGLSDSRERELATDPRSRDTDHDGIHDSEEVWGTGDPTLYDIQPPEIEVVDSNFDIPSGSLDTTYWATVRYDDPAGASRIKLLKDGNTEASKPISGQSGITTISFTEKLAESETDIDTSSTKSTLSSIGSKSLETFGSVSETVGDTTAGTTVYLEASDTNGNERRMVAVQRSNFYSDVAGDFYTETILDSAIAGEFGTVSGLSTSLGVPFQDVSDLIDDPGAVVEGIEMLLELIREERLGAAETLVRMMAQSVEQKQALNNPYGSLDEKEHPELYDDFREGWYEGYAAGFLAKTALGGSAANSAKNTIKSTKKVQKVGSKLADTKALRALSRISDAKKAAKGRATARILMSVDGDAPEPLLSSADTAGGAYRLWQHQRAMDTDVDAMPEAKQQRLGEYLARTGDDGADFVDAMDQDTLDDFLSVRRTAVPDGGDGPNLVRNWESQLTRLHEQGELDSEDIHAIVRRTRDADGTDSDALMETVAYGGKNGGYLVADLEDLSPLYRFVDDAGTDGYEFIRRFDNPDNLQQLFEFDGNHFDTVDDVDLSDEDLDAVRSNLVEYSGDGEISVARTEQFVVDIDSVAGTKGSERIVQSIARANREGDIDGYLQEARIAASSEREIAEIGRELGSSGEIGEIDIELEDETIVESKATDASDYEANGDPRVFNLASQIAGWDDGIDLEGRTVEIHMKRTPTNNDVAESIEQYIRSEKGSDITVEFKSVTEVE